MAQDNPINSIKGSVIKAFTKVGDFQGRANRAEFWWFFLAVLLSSILIAIIVSIIPALFFLHTLLAIAIIVPSISLSFRRLHDTGRSAWWLLLGFVPILNLLLIYFYILPGDTGPNAYGLPPSRGSAV
jgi:uncharacterized membrane protein YhaH (DUF805 family)